MKYGHATAEEIEGVDFTFPEDHANSFFAQKQKSTDKLNVYTGCGKWGTKEWVGKLYPDGTKIKDFLPAYLNTFSSIELNGTYYRINLNAIDNWAEAAAGTAFKYCPKWSRRISHIKRLKESEENAAFFIDACKRLGDNLGTTFLTLPPNFAPKYIDRVKTFLELIPDDFPFHIEFRHEEWFQEPHFSDMFQFLQDRGLGAVITDVALRRDALHQWVTTPDVFIRWNGYGLHSSDFERIDDWVDRFAKWKDNGLHNLYFFCHQSNELHTPPCCMHFLNAINEKCGMKLPVPAYE